jgi:plastocyanin
MDRQPRRRPARITVVALLALALSGAAAAPGAAPRPEVTIRLFQFRPALVAAPPGQPVRWLNEDDIEHTVSSGEPGKTDGRFSAVLGGRGASFVAIGLAPGVYRYHCERHPSMTGELRVR